MPIKHASQTAEPDDGTSDVSSDEWNELHDYSPEAGMFVYEECFFRATTQYYDGGVIQQVSGTNAATAAVSPPLVNHPGIISLTTGTTATGRAGLMMGNNGGVVLTGGKIRFGAVLRIITALSDASQTYTIRMGLFTEVAIDSSAGVYFRYTHGTNGGKWQGVARSGGVESTVDTGVTPDTTTWHRYEFEINAAGTSVEFFIDGISVGTISSNLPISSESLRLAPFNVVKSVGTTARVFHLDAYWYIAEFTTER